MLSKNGRKERKEEKEGKKGEEDKIRKIQKQRLKTYFVSGKRSNNVYIVQLNTQ